MKIHDKFVIELSEVIKGYGNDYRDEDPCHMPCDYKFYEISGVSICEESFKKMKRLEDEINDVIEKIRAEIIDTLYVDSLIFGELIGYREGKIRTDDVIEEFNRVTKAEILKIIDKYKAEQGV